MPAFKKPIAKVADAASKLFLARLEAIDVILAGADPHEVLMVCVHALGRRGTWMLRGASGRVRGRAAAAPAGVRGPAAGRGGRG
jgi:hypothetical protein